MQGVYFLLSSSFYAYGVVCTSETSYRQFTSQQSSINYIPIKIIRLLLPTDIKKQEHRFGLNLQHFSKKNNKMPSKCKHHSSKQASFFFKDEEMRLNQCQLMPKVPQQISNRAEARIQIFILCQRKGLQLLPTIYTSNGETVLQPVYYFSY